MAIIRRNDVDSLRAKLISVMDIISSGAYSQIIGDTDLDEHLKELREIDSTLEEWVKKLSQEENHKKMMGRKRGEISKTKKRKLRHYFERDPVKFIHFDFFREALKDGVLGPDADGDSIIRLETIELMSGSSEVRILIKPDTPKEVASRALRKVSEWVEKEQGLLKAIDPDPIKDNDISL